MLPLLTTLAALVTLTAVHTQTLRFNFAEPPLRSRATARLHTTRQVHLHKQNQGEDSNVTFEHAQHNPPQAARDLMM
jgi:hypothetical protein